MEELGLQTRYEIVIRKLDPAKYDYKTSPYNTNYLKVRISLDDKCKEIYFVTFTARFIKPDEQDICQKIFCTNCGKNSRIHTVKYIEMNEIVEFKLILGFGYRKARNVPLDSGIGNELVRFITENYKVRFFKCEECGFGKNTPDEEISKMVYRYGL